MFEKKYLYLFISLFFLIFSLKAEAYTMFSANPYINDSLPTDIPLGFVLYNPIYNNTFRQNATCSGLTNCLIIENNGTSQSNRLYLQQYDWYYTGLSPQWNNLTALNEFDSNNQQYGVNYIQIKLPANQEGILISNYRINQSYATPIPYLYISDVTLGAIASIQLNTTANVWYNISYILNASTINRYLRIYYYWNWDNLPTRLEIDKFKFYTYDINEVRNLWTSNCTDEMERYCGEASSPFFAGTCNSTFDSTFNTWNNGTIGILWVNGEDNHKCIVVKLGNLTIGRRALINQSYRIACNDANAFISSRDFSIIREFSSGNCPPDPSYPEIYFMGIFEALTLTTAKATIAPYTAGIPYTIKIEYDGTPSTAINISLFQQNNNSIRKAINLLLYSNNSNPSGYNWRYNNAYPTSWFPFFSSQIICTPQTVCDIATNYQYYQTSTCDYANPIWCGEWYCKSDLTGCNFGFIGSYCFDSNTLITVNQNGTQNYTSCYPSQCFNITSTTAGCSCSQDWQIGTYCLNELTDPDTDISYGHLYKTYYENCTSTLDGCGWLLCEQKTSNSISCYNDVNQTDEWCIDSNGNNVTCVTLPPAIRMETDYFGFMALAFGGLFGLGGIAYIDIDKAMLSIIFSIIFSVAGAIAIGYKSKEFAEKAMGYIFLGTLSVFTFGLNNLYLWAMYITIMIITAGIMSGALKKLIGGK